MRGVFLLLASIAVALLLASGVAMVATLAVPEEAKATFPGKNGRIAFVRYPDGFYGKEDPEIYTIGFRGDNPKRLTNNSTQDTEPAWSADGKKIAFSHGGRSAYYDDRRDIFIMDADGSDKTRITDERELPGASRGSDHHPTFSPGGRQIVFARERNTPTIWTNNDIFKIRTDGTRLTRVFDIPSTDYERSCCSALSPDGKRIAFIHKIEDDLRIETIRSDGTDRRLVDWGYSVNWSPDGTRIVYVAYGGGIYEIAADGSSEPRQLTTGSGGQPAYSPDGSKIVFARDSDLYIMDADGTDERRLTKGPASDLSPSWGRSNR